MSFCEKQRGRFGIPSIIRYHQFPVVKGVVSNPSINQPMGKGHQWHTKCNQDMVRHFYTESSNICDMLRSHWAFSMGNCNETCVFTIWGYFVVLFNMAFLEQECTMLNSCYILQKHASPSREGCNMCIYIYIYYIHI